MHHYLETQQRIEGMTGAERVTCCGRAVFRAQTEREPSPAELATFIRDGDYVRALEDPATFERLESQALKSGRLEQTKAWRAIGDVVNDRNADLVEHATLTVILGL